MAKDPWDDIEKHVTKHAKKISPEELRTATRQLREQAAENEDLLKVAEFMQEKCDAGLLTVAEHEEVLQASRDFQGDMVERRQHVISKLLTFHPEFRQELVDLNKGWARG